MDKFDHNISILRDIYSTQDDQDDTTTSNQTEYHSLLIDPTDEWQSLDKYQQNDEKFSPKIVDSLRLNEQKSCKRQLSMSCNESLTRYETDDHLLDTTDSTQCSIKRKCLNSIFKNQPNAKLMPPPTPLSSMKTSKSFDSDLLLESDEITNDDLIKKCNSFVYSKCSDLILDDSTESDEEVSLSDEDELIKKSNKIPRLDDPYLKHYVNLAYNLHKLIQSLDCSTKVEKNLNFDDKNDRLDHSLFVIKIVTNISHLKQFKLDLNSSKQLRSIYSTIKQVFKSLKEQICNLFKSIESDSMIKDKYELVRTQLQELVQLHGEYMLVHCANTFLFNRDFLLNKIEINFMQKYQKGIDKQYELYLNSLLVSYKENKEAPIVEFIECMQNFRLNCKSFKFNTIDLMIDYCNYLYQSNYRLTNACRFIDKQSDRPHLGTSYCEQILMLLYNILTDSLAFNTTATSYLNESVNDRLALKQSTDLFILAFKKLKTFYQMNSKIVN